MLAQGPAHRRALLGRGHAEAREQLLLLGVLDAARRPADRQALEEELDRPLPGVLARPVRQLGVLAPRRRRQGAAQLERAGGVIDARRRAQLLAARALAQRAQVVSAARSSADFTSPVSGSAWPGHAAAGSMAASLRIEARASSVSWLNALSGSRGAPLRPVVGSSV